MTVIGELAAFVTGAKASALPPADRERLRLHLADTVIAALAGERIADGKALQRLPQPHGIAERLGRRAATIRLTEIDDIHLPSCTTPSAAAVAVALGLAAHAGLDDPDDIAGAIWAGTEVMTRLGTAAGGPQILYRGIWPSYLAAPVAAAAVASRVLALDEARTQQALSLAFMQTAGGVGHIRGAPSGRWFLFANAVASGVAAAEAARADYRGDPDLLEADWLAATHGITLDRECLNPKTWARSVYCALSMKPFCSAKQGIAAIEAFRAILGAGVRADTIAKICVRVPPAYSGMIATTAAPGARLSTLVSVAHQFALAALHPDLLYDVERSAPEIAPHVAELSRKVEVIADIDLQAFYPQHWPAEVGVEAAGEVHAVRVVEATGDPERPLGAADIAHKAHRVLDRQIGPARVDEWLAMCHGALEGRNECRRLITAFAGA